MWTKSMLIVDKKNKHNPQIWEKLIFQISVVTFVN